MSASTKDLNTVFMGREDTGCLASVLAIDDEFVHQSAIQSIANLSIA
jgi:hypothetical protein